MRNGRSRAFRSAMSKVSRAAIQLKDCRTVFLDRDGTVNVKASEGQYITSPDDLLLIPGAAEAISKLNAASIRVILVTNQRWLASKETKLADYNQVHVRLIELLTAAHAHLDAAYYCPHATRTCGCRKPNPGMLRRAAIEQAFSLSAAVMIGDTESDITAGRVAGTATIRLCSGQQFAFSNADFVVDDLAGAVNLILSVQQSVSKRLFETNPSF
jgi:D-glycero-D-manno-heptose 1,7-bisphosphate phosphatase